jgi:hypothetical protein
MSSILYTTTDAGGRGASQRLKEESDKDSDLEARPERRLRRRSPRPRRALPWKGRQALRGGDRREGRSSVVLAHGTLIRWPSITAHDSVGCMPKDHNPAGGISARLVSLPAHNAGPPGINDYDSFAEGYTASNETSFGLGSGTSRAAARAQAQRSAHRVR